MATYTDPALIEQVQTIRDLHRSAVWSRTREVKEELAPMLHEAERIIVDEWERTNNIAHLCRIWGTGDRATIYAILEKWNVR